MSLRTACAAFLALFVTLAAPALAQEGTAPAATPTTLTVGVNLHPPFVMKRDGVLTGMAIDLWAWLAEQEGIETRYVEFSNIGAMIDAVAAAEIDVAVANITVTRARAERIEFTHPWFDAGQRIMVREAGGSGFWEVVAGLRESGHLRAYAWIGFAILVATVLMTLFDRRFDKDFPRRWPDGFAESFYSVMSVATTGRPAARKNLFGWVGRIWQGLWLVCGIAVLAYVTSSVTSVMTTLSLDNQINSVADLEGRAAGVQPGSVSEDYARQASIATLPFEQVEDAVAALLDGRIDAIIDDAPVLEYYAHANPEQPVTVVGPIFAPDKYAFGLVQNSDHRRPFNVQLIGAHETGLIADIRERYFGEEE